MTENLMIAADGSLTVPRHVCERMGWYPGQLVAIEQVEDGLLLPAVSEPLETAGGE